MVPRYIFLALIIFIFQDWLLKVFLLSRSLHKIGLREGKETSSFFVFVFLLVTIYNKLLERKNGFQGIYHDAC